MECWYKLLIEVPNWRSEFMVVMILFNLQYGWNCFKSQNNARSAAMARILGKSTKLKFLRLFNTLV